MNPYNAFLNLLPTQVKYIGKIISVEVNGDMTIDPIGAYSRTVIKGGNTTYNTNDHVMVVNGVVVSKIDNPQTILEESVIWGLHEND